MKFSKKDICMCIRNLVVTENNNNNKSSIIRYDFKHCRIIDNFMSRKKYDAVLVYVECIADRELMGEEFLQNRSKISKAIYNDIVKLRQTTNYGDDLISEKIGEKILNGEYKKYLEV